MYIKQIKWAWQRVVRGYDDRVYWSFEDYFLQVIPAIKNFCVGQLADDKHMDLNPKRKEVYQQTLMLIYAWEEESDEDMWQGKNQSKMLEYIVKHTNYYWD